MFATYQFEQAYIKIKQPRRFMSKRLSEIVEQVSSDFELMYAMLQDDRMVTVKIYGVDYTFQASICITYRYVEQMTEYYEGFKDDLYDFLHSFEKFVKQFRESYTEKLEIFFERN